MSQIERLVGGPVFARYLEKLWSQHGRDRFPEEARKVGFGDKEISAFVAVMYAA